MIDQAGGIAPDGSPTRAQEPETEYFESRTPETAAVLEQAHGSTKVWCCRFHPVNWWHEVGCPHRSWSEAELRHAGFGHLLDQSRAALLAEVARLKEQVAFQTNRANKRVEAYERQGAQLETAEAEVARLTRELEQEKHAFTRAGEPESHATVPATAPTNEVKR